MRYTCANYIGKERQRFRDKVMLNMIRKEGTQNKQSVTYPDLGPRRENFSI